MITSNIGTYEKVIVKVEKDYIKVIPTKDILDFAGIFKDKVKLKKGETVLDARNHLEKEYGLN